MQQRTPIVQTRRDAWVEINLAAIENNILNLKKCISKNTKMLAVVKADAYGHDSTMVAPTLVASGVDMFGVASIDEGLQLRYSGVKVPILVLGSAPEWAIFAAAENDIQVSVFSDEHLSACKEAYKKLGRQIKVHVKVDTGMHRIGIPSVKAVEFINKVKNEPAIKLVGVFSHFANAEIADKTTEQLVKWKDLISKIEIDGLILHTANTAGLIAYDDVEYGMVRAGIGIYGLYPDLPEGIKKLPNLLPAMGLKARIANIQQLQPNSGISYGHSFVTTRQNTKVATVPIGYADGVPRALSNKISGILKGQKVPQIGNITMDQMMFDVTNVDNAEVGDVITLIGQDEKEQITIDEWAKIVDTINYELICRLKVRLPRVFTR